MPILPDYAELLRCLDMYGYDVQPIGDGFLVRSRSDPSDVSLARHIDDLADLVDLLEWAAQRQVRQ